MGVDGCLPQQLARARIDGVDVRGAIADEGCGAGAAVGLDAADADRSTDRGGRLEEPVHATRRGAERVDVATLAADEHAPAGHGGLRVRRNVAGEAERPFELQTRDGGGREPGCRRVLVSRIRGGGAPTVPGRTREQAVGARSRTRTHGLQRRSCDQRPLKGLAGDELRNRAAFRRRSGRGHRDHGSALERGQHPLRRHRFEGGAVRGALESSVVTGRARRAVDGRSILGGQGSGGQDQ